jgi:hypothetical protein
MQNLQQQKHKNFALIAAIIGGVAVALIGLYFVPAQQSITMEPVVQEDSKTPEAIEAALDFVRSSPTFVFDGIEDSVKLESVKMTKSLPPQYIIEISFESAHGGFGNREGQVLTQAITSHKMNLVAVESTVMSAVTDDVWDEMNHQYVLKVPKVPAGAIYDFVVLVEALSTNGAIVEPVEDLDDSLFSVPVKVISVNGENVQIFQFEGEDEAQIASLIVSEDDTEIGTNVFKWISEPHFFTKGKIIVLYVGQNQETLNLLESLLGKQFAGM